MLCGVPEIRENTDFAHNICSITQFEKRWENEKVMKDSGMFYILNYNILLLW